jgi:hypothetical protein
MKSSKIDAVATADHRWLLREKKSSGGRNYEAEVNRAEFEQRLHYSTTQNLLDGAVASHSTRSTRSACFVNDMSKSYTIPLAGAVSRQAAFDFASFVGADQLFTKPLNEAESCIFLQLVGMLLAAGWLSCSFTPRYLGLTQYKNDGKRWTRAILRKLVAFAPQLAPVGPIGDDTTDVEGREFAWHWSYLPLLLFFAPMALGPLGFDPLYAPHQIAWPHHQSGYATASPQAALSIITRVQRGAAGDTAALEEKGVDSMDATITGGSSAADQEQKGTLPSQIPPDALFQGGNANDDDGIDCGNAVDCDDGGNVRSDEDDAPSPRRGHNGHPMPIGSWWYLRRWLYYPWMYSLSQLQARALLVGFIAGDGVFAKLQDYTALTATQRIDTSSIPLRDDLAVIGALAGARVNTGTSVPKGAAVSGSGPSGRGGYANSVAWSMYFAFSDEERWGAVPKPVALTADERAALGTTVHCLTVEGDTNFYVRRAPLLRADGGVDDARMNPFFSGNCFNSIDLPDYSSYNTMRDLIRTAIHEGSQGFGFR